MIKCKNCGREIMQGVRHGEEYWYHCIDFGDCAPIPQKSKRERIKDKPAIELLRKHHRADTHEH